MNKYNFSQDKGIKTTYNDFLFEQQAIRDAFLGILKGLGYGTGTFEMWGLEVTSPPGFLNIAEGHICIDGEIYHHTGQNYPDLDTGLDGYYWWYEEVDDPDGEKLTDLTTTTVFVRKIRRAKAIGYVGSLPVGKTNISSMRLNKTILNGIAGVIQAGNSLWPKLNEVQPTFTNATHNANWTFLTANPTRFRVAKDNYLEIYLYSGKIGAGSDEMFNLPVGSRPNVIQYGLVTDGEFSYPVLINPNGDVEISIASTSVPPIGGVAGAPTKPLKGFLRFPLVV